MQGLKVGHTSDIKKGTGVSAFIFTNPARGSYFLCGSGPATHELATLDPETSVNAVHALLFAGGSAFGLYAGKGVMRYLVEQKIGLVLPHAIVPIVPVAAIYDLAFQLPEPPNDEDAYKACVGAREDNLESGRIGAGTGATVGKIVPDTMRMSSGIGRAEIVCDSGLQVLAYAVVNAVGDIRNEKNQIIAGAKFTNGEFVDTAQFLLSGRGEEILIPSYKNENTTLVAVFTNAKFSKSELKRVAKMAIAGMARAINPVFTCYDGDILFCISLGEFSASVMTVGSIAAHAVHLAILDAVKQTEIVS